MVYKHSIWRINTLYGMHITTLYGVYAHDGMLHFWLQALFAHYVSFISTRRNVCACVRTFGESIPRHACLHTVSVMILHSIRYWQRCCAIYHVRRLLRQMPQRKTRVLSCVRGVPLTLTLTLIWKKHMNEMYPKELELKHENSEATRMRLTLIYILRWQIAIS